MEVKSHIDGSWMTSEFFYKQWKIMIKSRKGHGMKCHAFLPDQDEPVFTLRYSFITPTKLLTKAKIKIDKLTIDDKNSSLQKRALQYLHR